MVCPYDPDPIELKSQLLTEAHIRHHSFCSGSLRITILKLMRIILVAQVVYLQIPSAVYGAAMTNRRAYVLSD